MDQRDIKEEQKILDSTIGKIKDQTYYVWELLERKREQFKEHTNSTGDEVSFRRGINDNEILRKAIKEPYFGRFDIISNEEGEETFYIGKHGVRDKDENVIVVDWRMPIASVYYNFTPGKATQTYTVENSRLRKKHIFSVEVLRKKEFTIKDQIITKIIQQGSKNDSHLNKTITEKGEELVIIDGFLREIIESSETTGYLKEIISTIQKEQDKAIRQPLDRNVIVQGVAGSGKSSIALHRLSYLLYNNKHIKPEDVLILGPSQLFISSVTELLPELNLEGIKQATFQKLIVDVLKPHIKDKIDLSINNYFEDVLFNNEKSSERQIVEFKGTEKLSVILDIFVNELISQYEKRIQPIILFDERLNRENLLDIFNGYKYLPFIKKVEKFQQHIEKHFTGILDSKIVDIEKQYEFIINTFLKNGGLDNTALLKISEDLRYVLNYKVKNLRNEYKQALTAWKTTTQAPSLLGIYKSILTYEVLYSFENEVGTEIPKLFKGYNLDRITYFDLAPLFYIYLLLYDKPFQYSHIVVDEGQDLSYIHYSSLAKITKTMTVLGDTDQSIFMGFGQDNWETINESLFDSYDDAISELNTSYRSTKEIVNVANTVLKNQKGGSLRVITPLNRSGPPVTIEKVNSGKDLLDQIVFTIKEWKKKYKRIAIIHKTEQKAKRLADLIKQEYKEDVIYINPEQEVTNKPISVLASYYSKGMEFDAVILANVNEESFPKNELHARLLYVMLTRAQQEVKLFYQDTNSLLLKGLVETPVVSNSIYDDIL
ncbi:AAA family ATPase [Bacillus sp. ISL-35]|uniref:HelD family protein n=1 Tax=Bacillus sp. ISL-35 TaxID=2819122 RepID=UPI001BE8F7B8|nr:3'-5' exonuclease [Bacillus sp. ISL-35]MBT2679280.1 AAA family ATPase [Bacillus sp. ISL-35]MBT2703176.1 AAA family ATPase [Chryseobacterium sp. ISL-80]